MARLEREKPRRAKGLCSAFISHQRSHTQPGTATELPHLSAVVKGGFALPGEGVQGGARGSGSHCPLPSLQSSYPIWEDFNSKATKLHSQLR